MSSNTGGGIPVDAPFSLMISDLHLCDARQDLVQAFRNFCRLRAVAAQKLFILGDLSDAWVGDDDDSETAGTIRAELSLLGQAGTQVFLMSGNRDFLMGEQLAADCGLSLLEDPSIVTVHGHRMLLMHGDSLCTDDREYMAFRAQIRNREAQQQLLSQSLEQRRAIAAALRAQSKSANATKAEDIMDVSQVEVERVMREHNIDLLVHGHTHRPAVHEFSLAQDQGAAHKVRRIVLGDWDTRGWCLRIDDTGLELQEFSLASGE